jgi:hypothetical protein
MLTDAGRKLFAKILAGTPPVGMPYIELGTSGINPARSDVALYAGYERKVATVTRNLNVLKFEVEFGGAEGNPAVPGTEVLEAGIFWDNAGAALGSGEMLARVLVAPARAKVAGNILGVKWTGTINQCDIVEDFIDPSPSFEGLIDDGEIDIDEIADK